MTSRNSQRVPPCSAREPRALSPSTGGARGNLNNTPARERLIDAERGNPFSNDTSDQPGTVVLIGIARHGLGTIVRPFIHISFHGERYAD